MKRSLLLIPILCIYLAVWAVIQHQRDGAPIPAYGHPWASPVRRPLRFPPPPGSPPLTLYHFTYHGQVRSLLCTMLPVSTIVLFKEINPYHYAYQFSPIGPVPAGWHAPTGWQRVVITSNN